MSDIAYRRILGAVDLTVEDNTVIERFAQLVRDTGAAAKLLYVLDPVPAEVVAAAAAGGVALPGTTPEYDEQRLAAARERLAGAVARFDDLGIETLVTIGSVVDVVLDCAGEFGADVIVLGSHGRSGIRRVLGSTASAVVHLAECDVLTVRLRQ